MNIRERLEIRALVNLVVSVIERLTNLVLKFVKPKDESSPANRKRRLKIWKK